MEQSGNFLPLYYIHNCMYICNLVYTVICWADMEFKIYYIHDCMYIRTLIYTFICWANMEFKNVSVYGKISIFLSLYGYICGYYKKRLNNVLFQDLLFVTLKTLKRHVITLKILFLYLDDAYDGFLLRKFLFRVFVPLFGSHLLSKWNVLNGY